MTYKELKNKIESYEKNVETTFYERGEGKGTNKEKDRRYIQSLKRRDVAFSALFDIYNKYINGIQETYNKTQEQIMNFKFFLENQKSIVKKQKNLKSSEKLEKIEDIDDMINIYPTIFNDVMSLEHKDFIKIMKYAGKKKKALDKIYLNAKKEEDKKVVDILTKDVERNYYELKKDKLKRENTFYHVGTPQEVINAITKEQIIYNLLMNAIKNALIGADSSESIEEDILASYSSLEAYPTNRDLYLDDEAYELSQNNFDLYNRTYKNVFLLSKKSKNKLSKNLSDHLS